MKTLNLRRMKNTDLPSVWGKYLLGPYTNELKSSVLQLIFLFTSSKDDLIRNLGYRLALLYTKQSDDTSVIHAISSMSGLAPVTEISKELLNDNNDQQTSVVSLAREALSESLKEGDIYLTIGQSILKNQFLNHTQMAVSVIAPTSYGKSTMMSEYVANIKGNFCVIVPTKSLLSQTRTMFMQNLSSEILSSRKLITHYEMYKEGDENIIAILTQERFLRLLQNNPDLIFDHLIIDESHNLFGNDSRARSLTSSMVLVANRSKNANIKFLSPFISDSNNLLNRINKFKISSITTQEYVKSELFYHIDFRGADHSLFIYDQFMNQSYSVGSLNVNDEYRYICKQAGDKNIIYLNRPIVTHKVAKKLLSILPEVIHPDIDKACEDLAAYLHKDYLMVECIKKGVIIHHGSVPDNIRLYLEHLYTTCVGIRFIITTSTLLEGVNLPANKMFLLDIKKGLRNLSATQLKNLVGRVSRFKEVFSSRNLGLLMPEIHFVGGEFFPTTTKNIFKYLKKNLAEGKELKDIVENPMLSKVTITKDNKRELREELSYLGNAEPGSINTLNFEYDQPKTEVGRICFLSRISDFNILEIEMKLEHSVSILRRLGTAAKTPLELIEVINEVFLKNLPSETIDYNKNLKRLRDNIKARDFYAMILSWRCEAKPYSFMINNFLKYWITLEQDPIKKIVYAGPWGTRNRTEFDPGSYNNYVDLSELSHPDRVTLAIARIEAEMAYIDFNIMKYSECLNSLGLIETKFYNQLKFGVNDGFVQELLQAGMSLSLAKLLATSDYMRYIDFFPSGIVALSSPVIDKMVKDNINGILIYEANAHIK